MTRWLNDEEQAAWRALLAVQAELPARLNRELQRDCGLSLQDFDVLVQLTEQPDGRQRVSGLAAALGWERSRVSHHVSRMAKRGLVSRVECDDDGRGAYVEVTAAGRTAIEGAAPGHVEVVRHLVFDALTPDEVGQLGALLAKLRASLEPGSPSA